MSHENHPASLTATLHQESPPLPVTSSVPAAATTTEENVLTKPGELTKLAVHDLKMTDVSQSFSNLNVSNKTSSMMSLDEHSAEGKEERTDAPLRRKSTLILTEEAENALYEARKSHKEQKLSSETDSGKTSSKAAGLAKLYPVEIKWIQGGSKVYVTGSFTGWTKMIKLKQLDSEKEYSIKLNLPVGTHRFRFVVDNELRFSDYLPTATDSRGNFVNYIEILGDEPGEGTLADIEVEPRFEKKKSFNKLRNQKDSKLGLTQDDDDMGNGYSRLHDKSMLANSTRLNKDMTYSAAIPAIFTDPQAMERYYLTLDQQNRSSGNGSQWLIPPQLPPHLENVILNNQQQPSGESGFNKEINAGGSLPIPNHAILNHLATTSIKHNTLAVATTVRYKKKYLTQILYAPLQ